LEIMKEVRWELDLRGYREIKLFLSGGIDERDIERYNPLADSYGIGTTISNAPVVVLFYGYNRNRWSSCRQKEGRCQVLSGIFRCKELFTKTRVSAANERPERCSCGGVEEEILVPFTSKGHLLQAMPKAFQIRDYVLEQLSKVEL